MNSKQEAKMNARFDEIMQDVGLMVKPLLDAEPDLTSRIRKFQGEEQKSMYEEAADELPVSNQQIHSLANLAQEMVALEAEIESRSEELKNLAEKLRVLEQRSIPDLMQEIGMDNFTLTNGAKITVKPFYSAKIPDENHTEAMNWLVDYGFASLIKTDFTLKFDREAFKEAEQARRILEKNELPFTEKEGVHHSTLNAMVKTQTESTDPSAPRPPVDLFGIFIGKKAKVTLKK